MRTTWKSAEEAVVNNDDHPPVVRFVDVMLYRMVSNGPRGLSFRSSEPLPGVVKAKDAMAEAGVDFLHVTSRLKVLANLTPQRYAAPVSGRIEMRIARKPYRVDVLFEDELDDPRCTIRITDGLEE